MSDLADIKLLVFDVDGVLTDGSIYVDDKGVETKRFHVRDGFAIRAATQFGLLIGVLTGRSTPTVTLRMSELGINLVIQGSHNKAVGFEAICQKAGMLPEQAAYVGDDLIDLPALLRCGYPIAVADAVEDVRSATRYVTRAKGGNAAAREIIEHILRGQGKWEQVIEQYRS